MSMLLNMIKHRENLSASERVIFDYLIKNKESLKDISVKSVSDATFTSPASVVRMCKKLGYEGFKEFKVDYILANSKIEVPEREVYKDLILMKDTEKVSGKSAILNNIRALEDTIRLHSEEKLNEAARSIMTGRKILIFGKGSSFLVAKDLQMKLRRIDKFCIAQEDSHEQLIDATFLVEKDVVILISNSGETKEILQAAMLAKEKKATLISIVKAGSSTLANVSDISLYTSALEGDFRSAATTSRVSQMSVIDALYTVCAHYQHERSVRKLELTYKAFQKYIK